MEAVRLVVWDLDETFWKGTVTEGGHQYSQEAHDIVIELARRGIMSAICSKNDLEPIRNILIDSGIWDYFIFPSINWEPKGPRLATMIEAVGLRPPTVLFIDDNPMNLAEAQHYVPGIQTANETIIPELLGGALFQGKDDSNLSRLKQYKLLEKRKSDEASAGGDNRSFLRSSDIQVMIDHDVEANLDRAIELINRTNQLNFTKKRLPDSIEAARLELSDLLRSRRIQAGLVRVKDRYGDYGYVGFYALIRGAGSKRLVHFCFSCRTLGMAIETWLFNRLGRPDLKVIGDVLNDVTKTDPNVDWVTFAGRGSDTEQDIPDKTYKHLILRGGCELHAIAHYLEPAAEIVHDEMLANPSLLTNHSNFLRYAVTDRTALAEEVLAPLGYARHHFETSALSAVSPGDASLFVMGFWSDGKRQLYRHRSTGITVPFKIEGAPANLLGADISDIERIADSTKVDAFRYFQAEFDAVGTVPPEEFAETLRLTLDALPNTTEVVIVLTPETHRKSGQITPLIREAAINQQIRLVCSGRENVFVVKPEDFETDQMHDRVDFHFERDFYWAVATHILNTLSQRRSQMLAA